MIRRYDRAARWARTATVAAMSATVVSGVGLLFFYRPSTALAGRALTITHLVSIVVAAQGVVAMGVIGLAGSQRSSETARRVLGLVASLIAFVFSTVTGTLLGWDQLRLAAVTTGSGLRGFGWVVGDEVEFALVNDTVVGVDTIQRLLRVHLGSAIVIVVAGVVVPWALSRRSDPSR